MVQIVTRLRRTSHIIILESTGEGHQHALALSLLNQTPAPPPFTEWDRRIRSLSRARVSRTGPIIFIGDSRPSEWPAPPPQSQTLWLSDLHPLVPWGRSWPGAMASATVMRWVEGTYRTGYNTTERSRSRLPGLYCGHQQHLSIGSPHESLHPRWWRRWCGRPRRTIRGR